jgi:hypothetical protein
MKKFLLSFLFPIFLFVGTVNSATVTQIYGTNDTLMNINTNIATSNGAIGSEVSWTSTGYLRADCELNVPALSAAVAAAGGVTIWLLIKPDGTNYEDGSATVFPLRVPDMFFPLRAVGTAQRVALKDIAIPVGPVTALARNDTGVSMNGGTTPWTLKCRPRTFAVN